MIPLPNDANASTLKAVVTDIIKERFHQSSGPHIEEWSTSFPILDSTQAFALEVPFSESEIFIYLKKANGNKVL